MVKVSENVAASTCKKENFENVETWIKILYYKMTAAFI